MEALLELSGLHGGAVENPPAVRNRRGPDAGLGTGAHQRVHLPDGKIEE